MNDDAQQVADSWFEGYEKKRQKLEHDAEQRKKRLKAERGRTEQEKEAIDLAPAYLGFINDPMNPARDYANYPKSITCGAMAKRLISDARTWTKREFETQFHVLRDWFCPIDPINPDGGYKPKYGFDIDHILPKAWTGHNHPRNYMLLSSSLNRSFQDKLEEKCALLPQRLVRQIQGFAQGVVEETGQEVINQAIARYLDKHRVGNPKRY